MVGGPYGFRSEWGVGGNELRLTNGTDLRRAETTDCLESSSTLKLM